MLFGRIESASADSLGDLSASIHAKFPDVSTIQPAELSGWMNDSKRLPPLLLDVREEQEYAVSHLPGAHRAQSDAVAQLRQLGAMEETPIVVYCSVGYRSALMAQKLQKAGFTNVRNLEGSIFAWANEGRPLVNSNGATSGAHPFNALWGRYLDKSKWHWKPEPAH
jgi:rhodanese-related sulfurtransferase